jgi:hypothetical protein
MATFQANPFAFLVGGIGRDMLSTRPFLLKGLEMNQFQAIWLRQPDRITLRILVEHTESSCCCGIAGHGRLQFHIIVCGRKPCRQ